MLTSDLIGRELNPSKSVYISRKMITDFGILTGDDQWIHMDPIRAANESPFGCLVAQGFLLIGLIPGLMKEHLGEDIKTCINIGFSSLRFTEVVREETEIYATAKVLNIKNLRGKGYLVTLSVTLYVKDSAKPALTADWNLVLE